MDRTHLTQQSSTAIPLTGEARHYAAGVDVVPRPALRLDGRLQWLLEGPGWALLRPVSDFVLLCVAVVAALGGPRATLHVSAVQAPLLALPVLTLLLFQLRGLYRRTLRPLALDPLVPVISGISVAAMAAGTIGTLINGHSPNESDWVLSWALSLAAVGGGRLVLSALHSWARLRRLVGKPALIVGAGMVGAQVARRLERHPEYGLIPIGFVDEEPRSIAEVGGRDVPVLGTIEEIEMLSRRTGARNLIVAFSGIADARISRLLQECQSIGIEVSVVPRMFDTINSRVRYDSVGGLPLMSFDAVRPDGMQFAVKHAFDRVAALLLLIVLSPLLLLVALAIRLTSPGPVLFKQRRVGRDGKVFDCLKFRSMRTAAPSEPAGEGSQALRLLLEHDTAPGGVEGEDRRTLVGRFLRLTSIDELPQLVNVLRGDMSLVGPRPERPEFVELFRQDIDRYGDRHRVKSGITGWAQVHGLRGQTSLAERVEWDNYYIANWSLALDLKILVLTLRALWHDSE